MARRLSSDDRASMSIGFVAAAILAFLVARHYLHWPDLHVLEENRPVWRNLYFWSSSTHSSDCGFFCLFIWVANGVNNTKGQPPRPWLGSLALLAGVSGILMTASLEAAILPRVGILDSLLAGMVGMMVAVFFAEGVPAEVWRNLFARNIDYAGRFLPLAGTLVCLFLFGFWVWGLDQRWMAHDYTSVTDMVCFVVGLLAGIFVGKRTSKRESSAAIA